jgi:hypothetical protein
MQAFSVHHSTPLYKMKRIKYNQCVEKKQKERRRRWIERETAKKQPKTVRCAVSKFKGKYGVDSEKKIYISST